MSDDLGRYIGQYQVIEFIARGDTSFVYKGFQPSMNRYVAVKILPPSLARDVEIARQFQRQAELMAQLEHRNILQIIDSGQEGPVSFIISRFAEGGTLKESLAQYRELAKTLEFIEPITEALAYLHNQGLVHGNLSSDNILIDEEGQPLLIDIALPGSLDMKTPASVYKSPEQGQGGPIDGRSDIYAMGVILYELLIGEPPEVGRVPSPRLERPDLPTEVEKVILKSMAQYPEQRFQTVGEFRDALENALKVSVQTLPVLEPELREPSPESEDEVDAEPELLEFPIPETEDKRGQRWIIIVGGLLALIILICAIGSTSLFLLIRDGGQGSAEIPLATARVDTNVFSGPNPEYDIVGIFRQGQSARVVGLSPDGLWWSIVFPDSIDGKGWVPDVAVLTEDVDNVPIVLPTSTIPADIEQEATTIPTNVPPTLVPTQPPPTNILPSSGLTSTEEPLEAYPPVPSDELPTSYPSPSDVPPTLVPTNPTEEISTKSAMATEPPYPSLVVSATPVSSIEESGGNFGNAVCGLPALAMAIFLLGVVRPQRRIRSRR